MGFQFTVGSLMTRGVKTLERGQNLSLAKEVMAMERIRHVPIVDEARKLVGILSQRDLFRGALETALGAGADAADEALASVKVEDVMATDVATVRATDHVRVAARLMLDRKVGCVIALDEDGTIAGILSESDFVGLFARKDD